MKRLLLIPCAALALLATASEQSEAAQGVGSSAACSSGPTTIQGVRAYTSCGPATAVVKLGGRTLLYRGGTCRRTAVALELNIGTAILGSTTKPLPRYFGVVIGRLFGVGQPAARDGAYSEGMLVFVDGGKRYAALETQLVLTGGRTQGSFTGPLLGGPSVSGTFRCS